MRKSPNLFPIGEVAQAVGVTRRSRRSSRTASAPFFDVKSPILLLTSRRNDVIMFFMK